MISPRLMKTPMPARQVRVLLVGFLIRHVLGIALFGCLIGAFLQVGDGPLWTVLAAFGAAVLYVGVAVYNGIKIWKLYQRRVAAEQSGAGR